MRVIARCEMCGRIIDGVIEDGLDMPYCFPRRKVRPDVTVEVLGRTRTLCPPCAVLPAEELVAWAEKPVDVQPSVMADPVTIEGKNPT